MRMCLNAYSSSSATVEVAQVRDEVAPLELGETRRGSSAPAPSLRAQVRDRAGPEDGADHGGVVGQPLLLRLQPVETRADQALHARRDRDVAHLVALPPLEVEQPLLPQHPDRLLEEERIAAGVCDQVSANGVSAKAGSPVRSLSSAAACSGPSVCSSTVRRWPSLPEEARRLFAELRAVQWR